MELSDAAPDHSETGGDVAISMGRATQSWRRPDYPAGMAEWVAVIGISAPGR